jgi:exopolysaccharide biosynthesis WecB/TagA/CpsF family protein
VDARLIGTVVLVVAGAAVAPAPLYLLALALAALRRRGGPAAGGRSRIVVLIPAHNEAELLPRCLASLAAQTYPGSRRRIVVVADNCDDDTALVARAGGAEVMVRDDPALPGKGRALRWTMDRLIAEPDPVDGIAVVDADSVADPGLIAGLEAVMAAGAEAVQGEYLVLDDGTGRATALRQAAFLLFHRVRFTGRDVLRMPCTLVGNGMLFRRSLLERLPWDAFTGAEDLEYSVDLRLAGVRPRFAAGARVAGPASGLGRAGATQRMRWEGGRAHVIRTRMARLVWAVVGHGRWSLVDAVVDLAVPPLGLLLLLILAGGVASLGTALLGAVPLWAAIPWGVAAAFLAAYVVVGLIAARAPASAYLALLSTPRFLVAKLGTYLRMLRGTGADRWERTERPGEARRRVQDAGPTPPALPPGPPPPSPSGVRTSATRVDVLGVPIDPVDHAEAIGQLLAAVGSEPPVQVCTVNLQFLVTARRRPEVAGVLRGAGLNVADGAPVLWLSRLLGHRLPGRVAGSDLVPALAGRAEMSGARLFLLGGRDGAAGEAATELTRRHPRLRVTGTMEPPYATLDEMPDDEIVSRITAAGVDILLVGFGHPKQDLWIAANRHRLPVSVAIGVGGTFDLIAGRLQRAPAWARRSGLEWLYRLVQEPRRLGLRYATCAVWLLGVLVPLAAWQRIAVGVPPADSSGGEPIGIEPDRGPAIS